MPPFLATFRVFGLHTARIVAIAVGVVLGVGLLAGTIRLLPWLVSETLPLGVALPFGWGLFSVALEAAFLVGLPVGFALASALFVERNEARALHAVGIGPLHLIASTLPLACVLASLTGLVSFTWGQEAAAPGRMARLLVEEARRSCLDETEGSRAVEVPFVGATWLCREGEPPFLVARLEKEGAVFTASSLEIDDRLDALTASDLRLALPHEPSSSLFVSRARLRGIEPFARPSRLSPTARAVLIASTSAGLSLLVGWIVLRFGRAGRVEALVFGGVGPVLLLGALPLLERLRLPAMSYLVIPLAQAVAIFTVLAVRRCMPERSLR